MAKINLAARKRARRFALQALYQWHFNKASLPHIINQFLAQREMESVDIEFFQNLVLGVVDQLVEIEEAIREKTTVSTTAMEVETIIIKMGLYELKNLVDIPYRVVINEAVELTKIFGARYGYVNGVLHALSMKFRSLEV